MAEHAKPRTLGDFLRRFAVGMRAQLRDRLPGETWRGRLRFLAGTALVCLCFFVPLSYSGAHTYLTGEPVTARITRCEPGSRGGPARGYFCDGLWTLADGRVGLGRIEGIAQRDPMAVGTRVAVRATPDAAVTDSAQWLIELTLGGIGVLGTLVLIVRLFRYLIRASRPPGESRSAG